MLNPIKKELERLAHEILAQKETTSATALLDIVQALYKALVVLEHQQQQTPKFDEDQQREVIPVTEKINALVTELPLEEESAAIEDLFATIANPVFIKKEENIKENTSLAPLTGTPSDKNLNDILGKGIQIGLNDRIAFINNLFDQNEEDFQRVISQVQTLGSWEEAQNFIEQMIKPDYEYWEGKEEFETRFLKCLESNF
ncbi:MAG: hypothetical protein ACPGC8_04740 [Flavobacteriaceae bacterium]